MQEQKCRRACLGFTTLLCLAFCLALAVPQLPGAPQEQKTPKPMSLCVAVDATPGWYSRAIGSVLRPADPGRDPHLSARFAAFDQEREGPQPEFSGAEVLQMPPETPLREVVDACIGQLAGAAPESLRGVIVVAHEESFPSWMTAKELMESAEKSRVRIHAISLARRNAGKRENVFQRAGRALVEAVCWLGDGVLEGSSHSRSDTTDMLKRLADSTGGRFCPAASESDIVECADGISAAIRNDRLDQ